MHKAEVLHIVLVTPDDKLSTQVGITLGQLGASAQIFRDTHSALSYALENHAELILLDINAGGDVPPEEFVALLGLRYSKSVMVIASQKNDIRLEQLRSLMPIAVVVPPLKTDLLEAALMAARSVRYAESLKAKELEQATEIILRQTGEMLDSLRSAKNIQRAILPTEGDLMRFIPDSFVLNLPKESLGGDFFWFKKIADNKLAMAAIDCTGHGVPGALMSILVNNELNNRLADSEASLSKAFAQLDRFLLQADEQVFANTDSSQPLHAGFDAAAVLIDFEKMILSFCGAKRPLWLLRQGQLIEFKGDRASVGLFDHPNKIYTEHIVSLQKGDTIYMFSDGYVDQFGGNGTERFKVQRFRELILRLHELPVQNQPVALRSDFRKWRGISEQTDDVLIIGARV